MIYQDAIKDEDIIDGLDVRYLKFFGLWKIINDYRTSGKRNVVVKLHLLLTILVSVPYVFLQYMSYFFIDVDMQKATYLNVNTLPAIQACCKVLVLWTRLGSICKLSGLMKKEFIEISEENKAAASEICKKITYKSNILYKTALCMNAGSAVVYLLSPGISVDYILYHTGNMAAVTTGRKKHLAAWYPLPFDNSPYFEIVFAFEALLISWDAIILVVYICMYYQILTCLYVQFTLLGLQMSSLKNENIKKKDNIIKKADRTTYDKLYRALESHKELLSYTNELKTVYNPLVTMILGIGIFVLIMSVFQFLFSKTGDIMVIIKSLQFLGFHGLEVSMFCFGSSAIESASSELDFAIYSSYWYEGDNRFKMAVQMVTMRAKKGMTLTAIRMLPINLETMVSIFKFTYSTAAFMSSVTE
ncbi:odorant receptor 82a-like [Halyomorpha halys]|uniref:odorant receptor 82a-like n=1 Tax=Halyomorpha halys TaxID=286706 RepID=UPI0006D4FC16|nr:Odorant receptor 57 [Halyomorpha halys]